MPFYQIASMAKNNSEINPAMSAKSVPGEFMKAGFVTKPEGEGPPLHMHPNEEQFMLVISGKMNMILGEENKEIQSGDLIHIPRNTRHGIFTTEGPAVFFAVKSPCGDGTLDQDYNKAEDAEEVMEKLSGK